MREAEREVNLNNLTHTALLLLDDLSNSPSTSTADTPTTTKSLSVLKCMSCSLAGHSHCQSKTRLAHLAKRASLYLAFRCAMCTGHNFPPCCKLCHQKEPSNDTFIYASFLNDDDVNDNSGSNNGGGGSGNNIASSMNAAAHMDSMGILFRCERCRCAMHMTCLVSKFQRDYPNDDLRALKLANSISSIGGSGGGAGTSGGDASLSSRSIIASSSTSCSSSSPFNYFTQSWRCVDCITWDLPVEKVLTWRDPVLSDISNSSKSSSPPLLEREYLVNFSSLSYLHNEWVPESWLKHSKDAAPKLRDYILLVEEEERAAKFAGLVTKTTSRTLLVPKTQAEVEDIAFTTVEKVLDVRFAKEFVGNSNAATAVAVVTGSGGMLAAATVGGTTKSSMGLVKTSTSSSSTASSSLQQQWKNQQGLSGAAVTSSFDNICEVLIKWAGLPYENATWEIYPSKKDDALRTSYDAVTAERLRRE